jgi:hypothetical protein
MTTYRNASSITFENEKDLLSAIFYVSVNGSPVSDTTGPVGPGELASLALNGLPGVKPGAVILPYANVEVGQKNIPADVPVVYEPGAGPVVYVLSGADSGISFTQQQPQPVQR